MNNSTQNTETQELKELKNRREQQQLTVQTVADGMKVSKDFIHYIESGEFEKLGAPTFVRGHITNYCKVLGIEPSSILKKIPEQYLQHQQLKTSDAMGVSPFSHVRRQSNYFGRYAVGTALLGMLCMSFYFIWDKWSLPTGNQTESSMIISQDDIDGNSEKKITYSSLIPQVTGPNYSTDLNSSLTTKDVPNDDENTNSLDESQLEDSDTKDNETPPTESIESLEEADLSAAVNDTEVSDSTATAYSIVMQIDEPAWVSIKKQNGDFIVRDLMEVGLKEFQVTEPVHFRIGNAQKIQLSINNDHIELTPIIDKDIADFKWPLEPNS